MMFIKTTLAAAVFSAVATAPVFAQSLGSAFPSSSADRILRGIESSAERIQDQARRQSQPHIDARPRAQAPATSHDQSHSHSETARQATAQHEPTRHVAPRSPASAIERNIDQQARIRAGLRSGDLNTSEAARLAREQSQIERMQSRALRDGRLTRDEARRIDHAQSRLSRDIQRERHDAQTGNPNSASSQRMQAALQRNIHQQTRIQQGLRSGGLTNREIARLERGQARVNTGVARAGADGHVGAREHHRIQYAENRQSARIFRQRHDAQRR